MRATEVTPAEDPAVVHEFSQQQMSGLREVIEAVDGWRRIEGVAADGSLRLFSETQLSISMHLQDQHLLLKDDRPGSPAQLQVDFDPQSHLYWRIEENTISRVAHFWASPDRANWVLLWTRDESR